MAAVRSLPPALPVWLLAAGAGGVLGATLGSRYLPTVTLRRLLAAVLVVTGFKLLLVA
jgi:uncharacterized membrane protein YfcA